MEQRELLFNLTTHSEFYYNRSADNHVIIKCNNCFQVQQVFNLNDSQIIHMYRSPGYKNGLTSVHIDMKLSSIPVQYVVVL